MPTRTARDGSSSPLQLGETISGPASDNGNAARASAPRPIARVVNAELWASFDDVGNEMVLTRSGRPLFPNLEYTLELPANSNYSIQLSFRRFDQNFYKYNAKTATFEATTQPVKGASKKVDETANDEASRYTHPDGVKRGSAWNASGVDFRNIRVTNDSQNRNLFTVSSTNQKTKERSSEQGFFLMRTFVKYVPVLHVIEHRGNKQVEVGTFEFVETRFIAVSHYSNPQLKMLKATNNPHAHQAKKAYESGKGKRKAVASKASAAKTTSSGATSNDNTQSSISGSQGSTAVVSESGSESETSEPLDSLYKAPAPRRAATATKVVAAKPQLDEKRKKSAAPFVGIAVDPDNEKEDEVLYTSYHGADLVKRRSSSSSSTKDAALVPTQSAQVSSEADVSLPSSSTATTTRRHRSSVPMDRLSALIPIKAVPPQQQQQQQPAPSGSPLPLHIRLLLSPPRAQQSSFQSSPVPIARSPRSFFDTGSGPSSPTSGSDGEGSKKRKKEEREEEEEQKEEEEPQVKMVKGKGKERGVGVAPPPQPQPATRGNNNKRVKRDNTTETTGQ